MAAGRTGKRVTNFIPGDGRKEAWLGACVEPDVIIGPLWGRVPTLVAGSLTYLETT